MKRKYNNQTEDSRLQGDLIPSVVMVRPYKKPDFVCAAPGQKGVGSDLGGGSQMFPPSWQSLPDLPLTEADLRNLPLQLNCREETLLNTSSLKTTQIFERNTTFLVHPSFFLDHREKK